MMLSVLLILPMTLLVSGCPELYIPDCNQLEEIICWGGYDPEGCEMPHYCLPNLINWNGTECYNSCPIICGETEVICLGEVYDGCPKADFCMPMDTGCPSGPTATQKYMIMDAGWVTSAKQENAKQQHTEDKIIVLRETNFISQTISNNFQDTLFGQNTFLKPSFHI